MGRRTLSAVALVATLAVCVAIASAATVFPKPLEMKQTEGKYLAIDPLTFEFVGTGFTSEILRNAFVRYYNIIFRRVVSNRNGENFNSTDAVKGLKVTVHNSDSEITLETNESYTLNTDSFPYMTLDADTQFGALRGLETFSQLVERGTSIGAYAIFDKPRFQYRGSMIDTARHYYPVSVILQHLDAMSYAKMNVLHWHVVDDQSWPYQSYTFPEMHRQGAFSPRHVYTIQDVQKVITYAKDRGIRVIPEFDTPGHVTAGYKALNPPVLTDCYADGKVIGTGPLNPTINATYEMIRKLMAEIKSIFTDRFIHIGGDEVVKSCWLSNPQIKAWMADHPDVRTGAALQQYYITKLLEILKKQGSSYIVWQEIFDDAPSSLQPDTVVEVWKEENWKDVMGNVTAKGYHSVLAAPFYLNYIKYGLDWVTYYNVEPSAFTGGEEAERKQVLSGIEMCMWSEYVDASNFIARQWPRGAAVAERAWSAKDVRDVNDAQFRIHEFRCKLLERGINAEPIENGARMGAPLFGKNFCENEWNPKYTPPWH